MVFGAGTPMNESISTAAGAAGTDAVPGRRGGRRRVLRRILPVPGRRQRHGPQQHHFLAAVQARGRLQLTDQEGMAASPAGAPPATAPAEETP